MNWRPPGWDKALLEEVKKIPDPELLKGDMTKALLCFSEAGADAILGELFKLAKESPTKTFTIDSRTTNVFEVKK